MVSSIPSLGAGISIPGAATQAPDNAAVSETGTAAQPQKINTKATSGASAESSDDSSDIVKQLKKQIAQLQKQLQQQQQTVRTLST